jgi:hypothetical protein
VLSVVLSVKSIKRVDLPCQGKVSCLPAEMSLLPRWSIELRHYARSGRRTFGAGSEAADLSRYIDGRL